jgi:hypothetical protein
MDLSELFDILDKFYCNFVRNNSLYIAYKLEFKKKRRYLVIHQCQIDSHRCKHSLMTVAEWIRSLQSGHLNRELSI